MADPLVSIIVNNYNYGRFLGQAIDSALEQTYTPIEIIVVDDGSTDQSRAVIAGYGERVVPILKENGGQCSAFNAGIAAAQGEVICFLDADDYFYPGKVGAVMEIFQREGYRSRPLLVHHFMTIIDETAKGRDTRIGNLHPSPRNLYAHARRYRGLDYSAGPTTSIALNRILADRIFPIPEPEERVFADIFIVKAASLIGELHSLNRDLAAYRLHGANSWTRSALAQTARKPAYRKTLDDFLNRKLAESNLPPVVSFYESMYACEDLVLRERWLALAWQMLRWSIRQHDRTTASFMNRIARKAAKRLAGRMRIRRYSV
jgi:glycosyltransferase involved in cell wall biosynthesis